MLAVPMLGLTSLALALVAGSGADVSSAVTHETNTSTYFSVESDLSLSITLPATTTLSVTPTANGTYGESDLDVTVSTSNFFGYTLSMYAFDPVNTSTATTSLTNVDKTASITTIGSNMTAEQFKAGDSNKWAYSIDSGENFRPITTGAMNFGGKTAVGETTGSGTQTDTVTFGTKINDSIPNGSYSVLLNFMATAIAPNSANTNSTFERAFAYAGVDGYNGGYAMQDMTDTICGYVYTPSNASDTHISTQLIDNRDNSRYWVTKLADGKCWMTQNLDLDLNSSVALTSENTNLTVQGTAPYVTNYTTEGGVIKWTPSRSTIATGRDKTGTNGEINTTANTNKWTNNQNSDYSVDPGKWYETGTYFSSSLCNDSSWSTGCNFLNSAKTNANNGTADGEPLSTYFSTTPYGTNGEHGAIGNWYNWSAAVASSDTANAEYGLNKNQANSICPKGWTLPITAQTGGSSTTVGSWGNINRLYNNGSTSSDNVTTSGFTGLFSAPLYLVRGGSIYTNSSLTTLYSAGRLGYYWSSTAYSATIGYYLYFSSSNVSPASNDGRGFGYSVRCVAL